VPPRAVATVRSQAEEIAAGWSEPGAPASWALTAAIFRTLAEDGELLALAAEIPAERMPALLFCAAAGYLIDDRRPTGLVEYFPVAGEPQPAVDAGFAPALRAFCLGHRRELLDLCARRRYQMNEVARSTQMALALQWLGGVAPLGDVVLIDLGSGAGLGLHLDRYCHRVGAGRQLGDEASPLVLECRIDGTHGLPAQGTLPRIGERVGIDLDPLDLADPVDRRWARACIPPETDSLERFDRAARLVGAHPCRVIRGEALATLPAVLDAVPGDRYPVVTDAYTAVFFSDRERARLGELLGRQAAGRDLAWISLDPLVPLGVEGRRSVQGIAVPPDLVAEYRAHGVFALLGVVRFAGGRPRGDLLARSHPSGTTMTWMGRPG